MSIRLTTRVVAKPWGVAALPAPFDGLSQERIGEVWFEPPEAMPGLLVKYLFTSEALSVQVHPSNEQVPGEGKEECWLVTHAEPGARLAIGFREPVNAAAMRLAALDGSIEHLLEWHDVQPGDFFYIPAGTVHAIGAGISLIEVQQNSDTTYRLYDYGRPRELHLDQAVAVASGERYPSRYKFRVREHGAAALVDGEHFRLDRLDGPPDALTRARYRGALLVIPLDAPVRVLDEDVGPGECALVPSIDSIRFAENGLSLIAQN